MDLPFMVNQNENFSQKFSTLFIISFICLFNLILINLDLEGNIQIYNEEFFTDNTDGSYGIRQLQSGDDGSEESKYKGAVLNFFNNMSYFVYGGEWTSSNLLTNFEHKNGTLRYHLGVGYDLQTNKSTVINIIKILDGGYIDNWYYMQVSTEYKDITSNDTNLFYFNKTLNAMETYSCMNCTGLFFKGQVFQKMGSALYECPLNISYKVSYDRDDIGIAYINRIKGKLSTSRLSCDVYLDLDFELLPELSTDPNSAHLVYSVVVSTMILIQMILNAYLSQTISDSLVKSNSFSLFTAGQNVIWNAYGCLSHFFLAVNFSEYGLHFGIPAFLFFTNFFHFRAEITLHPMEESKFRGVDQSSCDKEKAD